MIDPGPAGGAESGAPELREQVSAARDRLAELMLVVVGISAGLGLVSNLLVGLLHDGTLSQTEWLALLLGSALTLALALAAVARLRLSTRELDEEIELAVPLLVPQGNSNLAVDVIEVAPYSEVTELGHAAVARLPGEQGAALARAARRIGRGPSENPAVLALVPESDEDDDEAAQPAASAAVSDDPALWLLQLAQLLVAAACLEESERLLGPGALFHRGRWLRRRTPRLQDVAWDGLLAGAGTTGPFLGLRALPGVRQRTTIPAGARIALADVAAGLRDTKQHAVRKGAAARREDEAPLVPLLRIDCGRTGWLSVDAIARVSAHAVPRSAQPAAGLTTRVFLRNARDNDLRRRALEEEAAARRRVEGGVPRAGARPAPLELPPGAAGDAESLAAEHTRLWRALYRGARRPRVARVYLAVQGRFRVRLSGRGSVGDQALYAWSGALARRVGAMDVGVLMARLAARQQMVPERRF